MSYDVWVSPSADDQYADGSTEWLNYTSNVAPMWRAAGIDLAECHGRPAAQVAEGLMGALAAMDDNPDRFRAMDTPNGWGDFDGCRTYLRKLLAVCMLNSSGYVFVSR